jgi:hypothetical protein
MNLLERLKSLRIEKLPLGEQPASLQRVRADLFREDLFTTARDLLGYKDLNWRTHGDMVTALEEATTRKLIVMPRGSFKSSISSIAYPIWLLMRDPNVRILLDSEIYSNSKNLLREIRLHLESEKLAQLFGPFEGVTWNEGEITIRQRTKIIKEASITASGIGAEKTGQHYDYIVCDDLNSPTNSHTPEGIEKVKQHYRYNISILEPTGTLVVVGTRYAAEDIPGYILSQEIGIEAETL